MIICRSCGVVAHVLCGRGGGRNTPLTLAERSLRASAAAHAMHARHDPRETTKAANAAVWAKYERQADPDGRLEPEERRRRAAHLMQADLARGRLAALRRQRYEQALA